MGSEKAAALRVPHPAAEYAAADGFSESKPGLTNHEHWLSLGIGQALANGLDGRRSVPFQPVVDEDVGALPNLPSPDADLFQRAAC
jgi:hypothetical protein